MRPPDDTVLLQDMLDYARKALCSVQGRSRQDLEDDDVLAAALERFIEILGEAAGRVSEETRSAMPEVPWRAIVSMRNRLVHGYAAVDRDIVWAVVTTDLPNLVKTLEHHLATPRLPDSDG